MMGEDYNCIRFYPIYAEPRTWDEWQCIGHPRGCSCTYESPPLIHLRGLCPDTALEHISDIYQRYTVKQSAADPGNIIIIGLTSARIEYSSSLSQWIYDSMSDLGEIRVYQRADFQSGSRVLKKVF